MKRICAVALLLAGVLLAAAVFGEGAPGTPVRAIAPGVEYATFPFGGASGVLYVVRVDPARATLAFGLASEHEGKARTAGEWRRDLGFAVAINAGMYATDGRTNVGCLRDGAHANNARWSADYKSALAFGPKKKGIPAAAMFDLDGARRPAALADYGSVVQNLRLLKRAGRNVWSRQDRRWSEAAVGMDDRGRVLLMFCRAPLSMWEFNEALRRLPLGVVQAMHVEGGPEASLSIHAGKVDLDLSGSYETGFNENDAQRRQWPIPNVIGVRAAP